MKSSEDKIIETFENYLRVKFLDLKNETQIDKKIRSFKKDLSERFKSKINDLKNLTLDQEKYNSMISEIICKMRLDESFKEDEKKNDINDENEKTKPQEHEQKSREKEDNHEEMSIDLGVPDFKNEAKESDNADEEMQIENSSRPDLQKSLKNNFGDIKYKVYTDQFDEIIKPKSLKTVMNF